MKLYELLKVLDADYSIIMHKWFDIETFVNKAKLELPDNQDLSISELVIPKNIDFNLIRNLKVLQITDNFKIYVGYEKYHS